MQDRPDAAELAQAVHEFIERELLPTIDDPRLRFRTLVALNGLGILERELSIGAPLVRGEVESLAALLGRSLAMPEDDEGARRLALELNLELARRIRASEAPAGTLEHLRRTAADKLRVARPKSLER